MSHSRRPVLFVLLITLIACRPVSAQQPPPQAPPQFQLNQIEQAFLDQVLETWQTESDKIVTFKCPFQRWEYNAAFGPGPDIPLHKDRGELSYQKPDKGSFQITEVNMFQAQPVAPGGPPPAQIQGDWVRQPDAIGEHWVCDGKAVYEYRHDQKQLVERRIPPELQGQSIVDGPLPFLFGAESAKLKRRYWMRIMEQDNPNEIWLQSMPKYQADAANYRAVDVVLDRQQLLPKAMRVHLPDGSKHVYIFDLANATINGHLDRLLSLFQSPRTPRGWKRVVEEMPASQAVELAPRQAAQPTAAPR